MRRFNEAVAVRASAAFATMGCFWAFLFLSLLPVVAPRTMGVVQFISSGVLQLVALPLISVASLITGVALAKQATEQHDAVIETLADVRAMQEELHRLVAKIEAE